MKFLLGTLVAAALFSGARALAAEAHVVTIEVRQDVRLTDPGKPLPEAWVAVVARGEGPQEAAATAVSTDAAGVARVQVEEDGGVVLVWKDGFAPTAFWADSETREVIALDPGTSVETRVSLPSGAPLAGAVVELRVDLPVLGNPVSWRELQQIRFDARSDAHGGATFDGLPAGSVHVRATAEGFIPEERFPGVPDGEPVRLVMRRGARIAGTVRAIPSGRAATGAQIVLGEQRTEVTADGGFELTAIPPGEYELHVEGEDVVSPPPRRLVLADGERRTALDLTVVEAARLPGRLRDAEGRRVADAVVSVLWPRRTGFDERAPAEAQIDYDVVTDEGGGFAIRPLRPADGVVVEVRAPGFVPRLIEGLSLPAGAAARQLDLVLERGTELTGFVVGADGAPLAEARVEARPAGDGRGRLPASWSVTGADGGFRLDGLPYGPLGLVVVPPAGSAAREGSFGPFVGGAEEPERVGDLRLIGGHLLRGRVTGAPEGALLTARAEDGTTVEVVLDVEAFEIAGLPAGDVSLAVTSHRAAGGAYATVELPSGWPVELSWLAARPLALNVVDPLGAPVPSIGLAATSLSETLPVHELAARAADGAFALDLEPARWRLAVRAGALFGTVEVDVPAQGPVAPVTLQLRRGETVRGEIGSRITGAVLEGARVELLTTTGDAALPAGASGPRGRFEIAGVPTGVVRLRVTAPGHAPLMTQAYVIERAASLDVGRIDVAAGMSLSGKVWSAAGTPARGAQLIFEHDDGTLHDVRTDVYGRFELVSLAAGGGRLVHENVVRRVDLPPGRDVEIEIDLGVGTRLEGRVSARGRAAPFARVSAWTLEEPSVLASARTDAHGRFALPQLPPVPVRLEVAPGGGVAAWETDVVLSGAAVDYVELELPERWIAGFVLEDDGGAALAGALVRVVEIDADGEPLRDVGSTVSDGQGRFRVEGVASGLYEVQAVRSGFGSAAIEGLAVPDSGLDNVVLRLPRESSLAIEIVDGGGRGVPGAWLAAARLGRDPLGGDRAYANLAGRVTLPGLAPGVWDVAIGADGRGHVELGSVRLGEGPLDLGQVMLRAAGALRVVVVHPGYVPAADVHVTVVDMFDRDPRAAPPVPGALAGPSRQHVTDAEGILLVPELAPGIYYVFSEDAPDQTLAIRIEPGDVAELLLIAPWPGLR